MSAAQGSGTSISARVRGPARWLTRERLTSDNALLAGIALVDVLAHVISAGNYGIFRDELYYIVAGRHPAFGYVDFPPMIAWLAGIFNIVAGDNLVVLHIFSALVIGCLVFVTGLMARELGGGRYAQALAAIGAASVLVFEANASLFSMDSLDALWWALGSYILIRILKRGEQRLWLAFGLVAGLGLFTKLTILFFGFAVVVGLLLTPERRMFRSRWPWLGGLIAFAFLVPYILWNARNGWPTWEFWHHYGGLGNGPVGFMLTQLLDSNIANLWLWIPGLLYFLFARDGRPFRALGLAFVICWLILMAIGAKPYFLLPAYPMLLAAGAVVPARAARAAHQAASQVEERAASFGRRWLRRVVRYRYALILAATWLLFLPLTTPLLPPAVFVASPYESLSTLGNAGSGQANAGPFPQYLGDRFGWDAMARDVKLVYASLPADERSQACILTQNYGEASALYLARQQDGLPPVISGNNTWYFWGPGACSGQVLITVGYAQADLTDTYENVRQAMMFTCAYCMGSENGSPILVATQPLAGRLSGGWGRIRHFD